MTTSPVKVLLIEDERWAAMLTEHMLQRMRYVNFEIVHRLTLSQGLEALASACDVVILDLNLPNGDGIKTLEAVLPKAGDTPVVVVTGESDPKYRDLALQLGASAYLVKETFEAEFLSSTLMTAIRVKRCDIRLNESIRVVGAVEQQARAKV